MNPDLAHGLSLSLIAQVALPLLFATSLIFLKRKLRGIIILFFAPIITLSSLTLPFYLSYTDIFHYSIGEWSPPLGIGIYLDGVAALFICLTALIFLTSTLYALVYLEKKKSGNRYFWSVWFILWGSLNALFLSSDIFNIYVTLELATLAAVILVAHSKTTTALMAAMRYFITALIGSMLYLLGVALIYAQNATLDMALLAQQIDSSGLNIAAFALMTVGLLLKSAIFPFHFWLPPAHGNASSPVSAILSAIVVKATFYLILRLWMGPFEEIIPHSAMYFMGLLGCFSIIWGSFQAIRQTDLKQIIAYSTVAQLGYLFLFAPLMAIGAHTFALNAVVYHSISHAFSKAALFLAIGNIVYVTGKRNISSLGGIRTHMQMSVMAVALASVGLIGLPPSGGFIAKWYFIKGAIEGGSYFWAIIPLIGSVLAAIYLFRLLEQTMRPANESLDIKLNKLPLKLEVLPLILSLISIVLGLFASFPLSILNKGL